MVKLNIRKKISLLIILTLVVAIIGMASVSIYTIKQKASDDIEQIRLEEMKKVEQSLKGYVGLAYQSVELAYKNIEDKEYIENFYGHRLKNIIDVAEATLKRRSEQVHRGELSLAEAQSLAKKEIQNMRYDNGTGYIWINNTSLPYPLMIMHPTVPALDGKILDDPKYNCALGKKQNLFQAMTEVCIDKGSGFVDYVWPKPTPQGLAPDVKKLSYVSLFDEWGWVLGTGIYLDDVKNDVVNKMLDDLANLKYGEEGYFWVNDNTLPYPTMIMHPTVPATNGKVLDSPKYNCTKGTNQNFFQLMVEKSTANGSGFVEYMWPKPGSTKDEPKLSFVKYFEPLGWVIGTGVYTDNIEEMIAVKKAAISGQINKLILTIVTLSILLLLGGAVAAFFLSSSMSKSIKEVKDRLQKLALGSSISKIEVKRQDEIGEMTKSLNNLVDGISGYTGFAEEIGKGNFDVEYKPLSTDDSLGNSLLQMRNGLKQVATEEEIRKWFNEGITVFGDIQRKYNDDLEGLCREFIRQLVKYMKANQASFFILKQEEDGPDYLELKACYAYERDKYVIKRIEVGEGLAGQVVLEKEYIYLTQIPDGYTTIRCGLGEATPNCLIVVPVISNEQIMGVFEMASFKEFAQHEIEFLLKVAENVASSISSAKVNEVTRKLLEETQKMAQEIQGQEEELRQNSEELMATQEEMSRQLKELTAENKQLRDQLKNQGDKESTSIKE